jgi:hypothetical protein
MAQFRGIWWWLSGDVVVAQFRGYGGGSVGRGWLSLEIWYCSAIECGLDQLRLSQRVWQLSGNEVTRRDVMVKSQGEMLSQ